MNAAARLYDTNVWLALSFARIGLFLWVAENLATYLGAWAYPGQEEVYLVVSGTVTFKVGDDVFPAAPQTAVRMTGEQFYSVHHDTDSDAELVILSTRRADPPFEKLDGVWPVAVS